MNSHDPSSPSETTRDLRQSPSLTPTLVIGLGGTGTEAVRFLKRRLVWLWHRREIEEELGEIPSGPDAGLRQKEVWRRYEMEGGPPVIQLLAVDTWPWTNRAGQVYLNDHEYAYIGGYNATRVLDVIRRHREDPHNHPNDHPEIAEWWQWEAVQARPGQIHSGARQIRAVGRLSFYRRYREFWRKLEPQLERLCSMDARQRTEDRGHPVETAQAAKRVYIVASLCGGTGAGIFLDVAALLRARLQEDAIITGAFALPSVFLAELNSDLQRDRVRANAYAALKEITHFQANEFCFTLPGERPESVSRLFNRAYLVERLNLAGESLNSIEDVQQLIANQIFLESMTDVGSRIWEYDVNVTMERRRHEGREQGYIFSSFANSSLVVPHGEMLECCELCYAEKLIADGLLRQTTAEVENQLVADAARVLGQMSKAAGLGRGSVEAEAAEEDEGEDEAEEARPMPAPLAAGTSSPTAPLEQFQHDFNVILQNFGLRGAQFFLDRVVQTLTARVTGSRGEAAACAQEVERASERLNARLARQPAAVSWNFPPFSLFVAAAVRAHHREIAALRRAVADAQARFDGATRRLDAWVRMQAGLAPLQAQLATRIGLADAALRQAKVERERVFRETRPTDQPPFEMFTVILGRQYAEESLFPGLLAIGLGDRLAGDASALLGPARLCSLVLTPSPQPLPGTHEHPDVLTFAPADEAGLAKAIREAARESVAACLRADMLDIRTILLSNNTHVQTRLRDLFARCAPFWRYNLDLGGLSEKDLERIVFVGLHIGGKRREWDYLLRDFPEFKPVETDDPTRIDACKVEHGLPIEYLECLPDLKDRYDRFFCDHPGPLHVDGRWEPNGTSPLPELMGKPPDCAAAKPPAAPPTSGAEPSPKGTLPSGPSVWE